MSVADGRKLTIRRIVRDQIAAALTADLNGETVMKEAWEHCDDQDEIRVAENELRAIISDVKKGRP